MSTTHRRVQYLAGICASLAFTFTGATISWSSPVIPKIKSGEVDIQLTNEQISWVVALAALGALPGCYIGQVLSEKLGRRRTICGAAVPGIAGAAMILFTKTPEVMYVARVLMGISNGITAVVTMIYLTEIADKEVRGALGMIVQVMINLGALAMYGIGPFVSYNVLNSFVTTLPIFNMLVCLWIPESPYYHLKDERYAEAKKEFMIIKGCKDPKWADQQLGIIRVHVRESMENKSSLKELLCNIKYRKAVYIITGTPSNITQKIMYEIRNDIRDTVQKELQNVLQFYSEKIDEYEIKMKNFENQISEYKNTCKNLKLKNDVLEQKINTIAQNLLNNHLEIHGVPEQKEENILSVTKLICSKLNQRQDCILEAYRKRVNKRIPNIAKPAPIVVVLSHGEEKKWLSAARNTSISSKEVGHSSDIKIQIREALTPNNSFLLWKAKDTLLQKGHCKFVWYKRGLILARRTEMEKPHVIRSVEDIERLESEFRTREYTK